MSVGELNRLARLYAPVQNHQRTGQGKATYQAARSVNCSIEDDSQYEIARARQQGLKSERKLKINCNKQVTTAWLVELENELHRIEKIDTDSPRLFQTLHIYRTTNDEHLTN